MKGLPLMPLAFFPSVCMGCGKTIDVKKTPPFCEKCGNIWSSMQGYVCPVCKRTVNSCICMPCFNTAGVMSHFYASVPYFSQDIKRLSDEEKKFKTLGEQVLLSLKHKHDPEHFDYVSGLMIERIKYEVKEKFVVAYPNRKLAPKLLYGHDQAKMIAQRIGREFNAPVFDGILHCNKTSEQKLLDFDKRGKNAKDSYYVRQNGNRRISRCIAGKTVVFVDDVITSGATAAWCASLLRQLGAKDVLGFFVARTCGICDIEQKRT